MCHKKAGIIAHQDQRGPWTAPIRSARNEPVLWSSEDEINLSPEKKGEDLEVEKAGICNTCYIYNGKRYGQINADCISHFSSGQTCQKPRRGIRSKEEKGGLTLLHLAQGT